VTAEPVPIRALLRDAADVDDECVAGDRRAAVLLTVIDRALGDLAHKATATVEEYAAIVGLSRGAAFDAVRRRDVPSLRFGRRVVIPIPAVVAQLLGCEPDATRTGPTEPVLVNPTTDATSSDRGERT
jgi:hypothetical protein